MPSASGAKKAKPMNKKNLQHFEKRLLEERRRVLKELGHYDETFGATPQSADGDLSSYSFHMADQGTDAMEREKAFLFASQEGRFLWHIDEALRRLYRAPETFGKCHNCGKDIAYERLDALPHARFCIECGAALAPAPPQPPRHRADPGRTHRAAAQDPGQKRLRRRRCHHRRTLVPRSLHRQSPCSGDYLAHPEPPRIRHTPAPETTPFLLETLRGRATQPMLASRQSPSIALSVALGAGSQSACKIFQ